MGYYSGLLFLIDSFLFKKYVSNHVFECFSKILWFCCMILHSMVIFMEHTYCIIAEQPAFGNSHNKMF
jgi:hypothetical protein